MPVGEHTTNDDDTRYLAWSVGTKVPKRPLAKRPGKPPIYIELLERLRRIAMLVDVVAASRWLGPSQGQHCRWDRDPLNQEGCLLVIWNPS